MRSGVQGPARWGRRPLFGNTQHFQAFPLRATAAVARQHRRVNPLSRRVCWGAPPSQEVKAALRKMACLSFVISHCGLLPPYRSPSLFYYYAFIFSLAALKSTIMLTIIFLSLTPSVTVINLALFVLVEGCLLSKKLQMSCKCLMWTLQMTYGWKDVTFHLLAVCLSSILLLEYGVHWFLG